MSRKRHKFDPDATAAAGFACSGSYITIDGKEFLVGEDMTWRRVDVWTRDKGICQICMKPVSMDDFDVDHFPITRGRGGDDSMSNLRTTHHGCHMKTHPQVHLRKASL